MFFLGWFVAKLVVVFCGIEVSRFIRLINGDGRICGYWVRVIFIFGYFIIIGRFLGCLGNVLGVGVMEYFFGRVIGVRGELREGKSLSGSVILEIVSSGSRL